MYYLGIDLGSSSLKIALVEQKTGVAIAQLKEPEENWTSLVYKSIGPSKTLNTGGSFAVEEFNGF